MPKIRCKHCDLYAAPVETNSDLVCKDCKTPFDYFTQTEYNNKVKKERVAADRTKTNKAIVRGIRR